MENFVSTEININFKITGLFATNLMKKTLDFLLFNRCQMPFSFDGLQNFIVNNKENEKCYKTISQINKAKMTYDSILAVKQIIDKEFFNTKSFLIIFGSTPHLAKEAYRIKFPAATNCIFPTYLNETSMQKKILLQLIQAENFKNLFSNPLSITNVFILFERIDDEGLIQGLNKIKNFKLNKSCKKYAIIFNDSSDFQIFCEEYDEHQIDNDLNGQEGSKRDFWYQSKVFIKGFNQIVASSI